MEILIGRGSYGQQKIEITEPSVSRNHCSLKVIDSTTVQITDTRSKFGTYICKTNIANQIPVWNPSQSLQPSQLTKVNGTAVASIDDTLFLGPKFHATIRSLLVRKNGMDTFDNESSTTIIRSVYDSETLNRFKSITEFEKMGPEEIVNIKVQISLGNLPGLAPHVYPMLIAASAFHKINEYKMQEAQKELYQAGDMMYEIAKHDSREMVVIYAEMMSLLCVFYKKTFIRDAFEQTKKDTIKIFKHLGMADKITEISSL